MHPNFAIKIIRGVKVVGLKMFMCAVIFSIINYDLHIKIITLAVFAKRNFWNFSFPQIC